MSALQKPSASRESWPSEHVEHLDHCPLCGSTQRTLLYSELTDDIFRIAPGEWSLWRCSNCSSAFLDPRPDESSIGRAYERYYTHEDEEPEPDLSFVGRWRTRLGNGYRNALYGSRLEPSSRLGPVIAALVPPARWPAEVALRYLPAARSKSRVLDVGCGSGAWLDYARTAGWGVAGVEPDAKARRLGCERGLDIRESLGDFAGDSFEAITLNHVIEHVHDPLATLRACRDLLKPGGMIYVDTPNIDAVGHGIYGRHWRGLETPRHLVLFNRRSLHKALKETGFGQIRFRHRFFPLRQLARQSQLIAAGLDPYSAARPPADARKVTLFDTLRATFSRGQTEFLTVTATPQ